MAAACTLERTGMSAVLGGDQDEVLEAIEAAGLYPANRNGAGQIVAAGALSSLEKLAGEPPPRARVKALKVAGAFHTPYMAPAEQALATVASGTRPATPAKIRLQNAVGPAFARGPPMLQLWVREVPTPVRWALCMRTPTEIGVTAIIELAPAGTLAGLAKRELKGSSRPEILSV